MLKLIPTGSLVTLLLFSVACNPNAQPLSGQTGIKKPVSQDSTFAGPYNDPIGCEEPVEQEPKSHDFIAKVKLSKKEQKILAIMCIGWEDKGFAESFDPYAWEEENGWEGEYPFAEGEEEDLGADPVAAAPDGFKLLPAAPIKDEKAVAPVEKPSSTPKPREKCFGTNVSNAVCFPDDAGEETPWTDDVISPEEPETEFDPSFGGLNGHEIYELCKLNNGFIR